jgi:Tfp pilus assembly protein PilF
MELARIYLSEKKEDKAIAQYNIVIEKDPKQIGAYMILGMIYEGQNKMDQAENQYRKALAVKSDFVPAANNLAYILADQGRNLDEALSMARIAKEKSPQEANVMDTLGWVYYKKGLYDNAIGELTECAAKMKDNPVVLYHLGAAYYKKGETIKAKTQLQKALSLKNDFPGSEDARAILSKI